MLARYARRVARFSRAQGHVRHAASLQIAVIMANADMDIAAVQRRIEEVKQAAKAKMAQLIVQNQYNAAYWELEQAQKEAEKIDRRLERVKAENARYRKYCTLTCCDDNQAINEANMIESMQASDSEM